MTETNETLDHWTLQQEHKDLKRAIKKVQETTQFYQAEAAMERRKRLETEQVLQGGIEKIRQDYRRLRPKLNKVREHVYQIILARPGLTYEQIHDAYQVKFKHKAKTDNRIRELFKEKCVVKVKGKDGLLHWYPNMQK